MKLKFFLWLGLWVDLMVVIIGIVTLNKYYPSWYFTYTAWLMKKKLKTK